MDYLLSDKHLTYVMLFKINNTSSDKILILTLRTARFQGQL